MIISASRRTDIPAFYSEWFINRFKEGNILIPHLRNSNRLSRVTLSPENIDCIVFWTKNPGPILDKLPELTSMGYNFYIQFTLTAYDKSIEANLPSKTQLIQSFKDMSGLIGSKPSVWRYDPIILDKKHSVNWHKEQFNDLCRQLQGYTQRCIISFVDSYRHSPFRQLKADEMRDIAECFSEIASKNDIALYTCAEEIDLSQFGIGHSSCVDKSLIEEIIGQPIKAKAGKPQRAGCLPVY